MNTPLRSSFHHLLEASSGARRSASRASATAARRTSKKAPAGGHPDVAVAPAGAARLREPRQSVVGQDVMDDEGRFSHVVPGRLGGRVEVDAQLVRVIEVGGARGPWVPV